MTKTIVVNEAPATEVTDLEIADNKKQTLKTRLKIAAVVVGIVLVGLVAVGVHNSIDQEMEEDSNE